MFLRAAPFTLASAWGAGLAVALSLAPVLFLCAAPFKLITSRRAGLAVTNTLAPLFFLRAAPLTLITSMGAGLAVTLSLAPVLPVKLPLMLLIAFVFTTFSAPGCFKLPVRPLAAPRATARTTISLPRLPLLLPVPRTLLSWLPVLLLLMVLLALLLLLLRHLGNCRRQRSR